MIMSTARDYIKIDKVNEYLPLIRKLIEETRLEEGNINYSLYSDRKTQGQFVLLEYWKDQQSLNKHFTTEHFITIVPQIQKLQLKPSQVNTYKEVEW